jgi:hypothetical protein
MPPPPRPIRIGSPARGEPPAPRKSRTLLLRRKSFQRTL